MGFAWTLIINVGFFRFLFCFFCINFNTLRIYTSTSSDFFYRFSVLFKLDSGYVPMVYIEFQALDPSAAMCLLPSLSCIVAHDWRERGLGSHVSRLRTNLSRYRQNPRR